MLRKRIWAAARNTLITICLIVPAYAFAQDLASEQTEDEFIIEEVIVTATRRAVSLQDVPQSITALTSQALDNMGAINLEDYALSVPGLQITKAAVGFNSVSLRGIRSIDGNTGAAVGYYLDETPVSAAFAFPEIPILDIERVEVLRGPQGTLYGEGSMGGTIRVITNKPNVNDYELEVGGQYSSTNKGGTNYGLDFVANMPFIQDTFAVRVAARVEDWDGYIDNVLRGEEDTNTTKSTFYRIAARWLASDALTIDFSANISRSEFGAYNLSNKNLEVSRTAAEFGDDDYDLYNLTVDYAFPWADLVSSSSWYTRDRFFQDDLAFAIPFLDFIFDPFGLGPFDSAWRETPEEIDMFVQEVRLVSTSDGPLRWTVGAFFKDLDRTQFIDGGAMPAIPPQFIEIVNELFFGVPGVDVLFHSEDRLNIKQLAAFGEVSYELSDRWEILGGLRVFQEDRKSTGVNTGTFLFALAGVGPITSTTSDDDTVVSPKGTITYRYNDTGLVYGTISKGFRSGGQNVDAIFVDPSKTSFGPESLWNYEMGLKSSFADGRMTFNGSIYYLDWSDMQVESAVLDLGSVIGNAGSAHSLGVDAEFVYTPIQSLQFILGGSWIEAELDEDVAIPSPPPFPPLNAPSGTQIPGVPEFTFNAAVDYYFPAFSGLNGMLHADYNYYGSTFTGLLNATGGPNSIKNPAFNLVNLRAGLEGEHWQAAVYVSNLFDERPLTALCCTDLFGLGLGNFFAVTRPRTIGVSIRYRF